LQRVRTEGAWEDWLAFFLEGIESTAGEASKAARRSLALFDADRKKIGALGRASSSALRVQEYMQKRPIANIRAMSKARSLSVPTVTAALGHLSRLGIAKELTGGKRSRVFSYAKYLAMVAAGTEPIR
jgi:Fic family protein